LRLAVFAESPWRSVERYSIPPAQAAIKMKTPHATPTLPLEDDRSPL
jgi:hypothetical protein